MSSEEESSEEENSEEESGESNEEKDKITSSSEESNKEEQNSEVEREGGREYEGERHCDVNKTRKLLLSSLPRRAVGGGYRSPAPSALKQSTTTNPSWRHLGGKIS
jgi:hypothetical protein